MKFLNVAKCKDENKILMDLTDKMQKSLDMQNV